MTPDQYRRQYLEPVLASFRPARAAPIEIPARHWFAIDGSEPKPIGLNDLFLAGVRCGHGESREVLAHRVGEVDWHLWKLQQDLATTEDTLRHKMRDLDDFTLAHASHVKHLEAAVEHARNRVTVLENSTSWRMTAPVRWTLHRAKLAARSVRNVRQQLRLLPPRIGVAKQILKNEGAAALANRLRDKFLRRGQVSAGLVPRPGLESRIEALHVPASDTPLVSVIVPTYGQDLHTYTCLKALAGQATTVPLEVLVMDDCAPTPASEALAGVTGVRFERNEANLGFVGNCNRGASLARGEFLLFLNNDAVMGEGALQALLDAFASRPDAGAVGAKLVYPDGRLQEAGGIMWRDASAWNYGRTDDPSKPEYNYLREADYCSGACLLVRRELFDRLGRFDTRFTPAYCEDSDLCFQVRAAGLKVYYQPKAEVVHFEGVSHGTSEAEGTKQYQVVNRQKFYDKWKSALSGHRVNGILPRLERDRGAKHRVLVVEACMLTPDQDSGSVRTWRTLRVLREMGCKVTFIADNLQHLEPYATELTQEGVELVHYPHTSSVEAYLEDHGADFDIIVLARYYVASRLIDTARRAAPKALLVLDTHDLHYVRTRRLAELEGSRSLAQDAQVIYHQEMDCIRRMDVTWVVSPVEKEILAREAPRATVFVQTNIHYPAAHVPPFGEREGIIFVGGYRHPPNVDAALFYAREVMPHLRELLPGVTSYLVGSNPPASLSELSGPGIEFVGYVPELDPWLARMKMSVSPLRYGAGVKGKINHSMAMGLPVVATTPSVEGMHLAEGEEILVADEPRAFAEAIARLYRDEALWKRLSTQGQANVRAHFSPEAAARALEATFEAAARKTAIRA